MLSNNKFDGQYRCLQGYYSVATTTAMADGSEIHFFLLMLQLMEEGNIHVSR